MGLDDLQHLIAHIRPTLFRHERSEGLDRLVEPVLICGFGIGEVLTVHPQVFRDLLIERLEELRHPIVSSRRAGVKARTADCQRCYGAIVLMDAPAQADGPGFQNATSGPSKSHMSST